VVVVVVDVVEEVVVVEGDGDITVVGGVVDVVVDVLEVEVVSVGEDCTVLVVKLGKNVLTIFTVEVRPEVKSGVSANAMASFDVDIPSAVSEF
jgi:hypothetical protein